MKFSYNIYTIVLMTISMLHVNGQSYCDQSRNELNIALQNKDISKINYLYNRLLHACGVTIQDKDAIKTFYQKAGYDVSWDKTNQYFLSKNKPNRVQAGAFTYEELPNEHSIKKKYSSLPSFLEASKLKDKKLTVGPFFIPEYHVIYVYQDQGDLLLDATNFNVLLTLEGSRNKIDYQGKGYFITNQKERTTVYKVHVENNKPQLKTLIDKPNSYAREVSDEILNPNKYFLLIDQTKEKANFSLFDNNGEQLYDQQDAIEINPSNGMCILIKDWKFSLMDKNRNPIVENAASIHELDKHGKPYYQVMDADSKNFLYDLNGRLIFDQKDHSNVYLTEIPHAIVTKNDQYAVIDVTNNKIVIPYQKQHIQNLYPGFFAYESDNKWIIVDDKNKRTATINARRIQVLNLGKLLVINHQGHMGVVDLFGKYIIPNKYANIDFDRLNNTLSIQNLEETFTTDLNGNRI